MASLKGGMRGDFTANGNKYTKQSGLQEGEWSAVVEIREDNAKIISDGIVRAIDKALFAIGLLAEGYAKKECPVDTGRLRNSVTNVVVSDEDSVYIGTNVEYAP